MEWSEPGANLICSILGNMRRPPPGTHINEIFFMTNRGDMLRQHRISCSPRPLGKRLRVKPQIEFAAEELVELCIDTYNRARHFPVQGRILDAEPGSRLRKRNPCSTCGERGLFACQERTADLPVSVQVLFLATAD
ncbi:hypothetical protein CSUI_007113 [Cystoisospora suis]|uniref:Uncharacterized protein n=1 Tax=Cystoisospora suis TaxID=483139 RepID=A0A2C6KRQ1_9APIC|nr:hypothetical protein CSUI_007113 [Cystoisospora suis]